MAVLAVVAFVVPAASGFADDEPVGKAVPAVIRVTGEATIDAKPDLAEINLGVVTQAETGQAAAAQNAKKQDAVLGELRKAMGAAAEIKTISYSLSPNYRYPKEGGQPTISGYTASNVVRVTTGELDRVGEVIDIATRSGANAVNSLQFTLKDEQAAASQALREAAIQARAKADALASALKVRIVRVLQAEEGGQPIRPMRLEAASFRGAEAAPTPVEPGTIEVRATVTLTVEIVP